MMKKILLLGTIIWSLNLSAQIEVVEAEVVTTENTNLSELTFPLQLVEVQPIFPGCEDLDSNCLMTKLNEFVQTNFNIKVLKDINSNQKFEMAIEIGTDGLCTYAVARLAYDNQSNSDYQPYFANEALSKEAQRVGKLLPKLEPGKLKGKAVKVFIRLNPF